MSEPKLISPLLDGFSMGNALSEHDGVRCYPALKENSDQKYIVKIISIPASQVQLDALLLTGAYAGSSDAMEYFKELADGVEKEAACLKNLARLEGFLGFEGWQVVPMENGCHGYEVYLLSSYRNALEKYVRRNNMTHLGALNLGIDICNALSAARRAGWIYVDLKPSNIYISDNREYRIGDLGLMELEGLELAALPAKYRSAYTAPELLDEMLSPNTTQDTYALGMILYQIYNNGQLPQVAHPTEDPLPSPVNADYELAEIILKACAPNPADRWEDPVEMGRALVAYMQRNSVSDIPIIPPVAEIGDEAESVDLFRLGRDETLPGMNDESELTPEEYSPEMSRMMDQANDLISHDLPAPPVVPEGSTVEQIEEDLRKAAAAKKQAEADLEAMLRDLDEQEKREKEEALTAEEVITLPVRKDSPAPRKVNTQEKKQDTTPDLASHRKKARRKSLVVPIILVLIMALLGTGCYLFYTEYYIQMINGLTVEGTENEITVRLDTDIDEDLLTIVCTDTYGNTSHRPVENGSASFANLLPDMLYKIRVEIDGFHRLDGSTTHEYSTPAETQIASYTAVTGPEDGSVILNFSVNGPDSEEWTAICTTEGQEPITTTFTGHMVTVTGLNVGSTYEIRLEPTADLYIPGSNSLEFTASSIIIAEDLAITTDGSGSLTVSWKAPEGVHVDSWDVHCYSIDGYDQKLTTDQLTATFDEISAGSAYTVEVTAAGMTQPARTGITANPIYITNVNVVDNDLKTLQVSWEFTGTAPEGGWLLLYTIDGSEQSQIVQCPDAGGTVEVRVPAATYDFTIEAADGSSVFRNTHSYRTPNAEIYENPGQAFYRKAQSDYFFVDIFKTPEKTNWHHTDIHRSMYTNTFASGESIAIQMYYMRDFYIYHEDVTVMYVIRDENGKVLSEYLAIENLDWHDDMWNGPNYHYFCKEIPLIPTAAGKYSLGVYFDGLAVTSVEFTITE